MSNTNKTNIKTHIKTNTKINVKNNEDIQVNGIVFFIPEKYITNQFLFAEHKKLYKYLLATYLTKFIKYKNMTINDLNKKNISDAIESIEKIITYITTGKMYIQSITGLEKEILLSIPESLIYKINPNIVEKIE